MKPQKKRRKLGWKGSAAAAAVVLGGALVAYKIWFEQPTQRQIDDAMAASDWSSAASMLRRADLSFDDGQNYFNLGLACMNSGDEAGALEAFMEADDRGFQRGSTRFYIASVYAKRNNPRLAMEWMNDAISAGFTNSMAVNEDPNLSKLSQTSAWKAFFASESGEGNVKEALNFFVGTWSITRGRGFGNGTLTVTRLLDGAVGEQWSAGGSNGMFVFDPETNSWSYSFVDGNGRVFTGAVLAIKQVTITGTLKYADGTELLRRIEIRRSSGVIDYAISDSRDDGRTWDDEEVLRLTANTEQKQPTF